MVSAQHDKLVYKKEGGWASVAEVVGRVNTPPGTLYQLLTHPDLPPARRTVKVRKRPAA